MGFQLELLVDKQISWEGQSKFPILRMYVTGKNISELFVLLLLDSFWSFLAGLPTNFCNEWLPRQWILPVHWPWRQG